MRADRLVAPRLVVRNAYPKPLMQKVLEISERSKKDAIALEQIADLVLARLNQIEHEKQPA